MNIEELNEKTSVILSQVGENPVIYNSMEGSLNLLEIVNLIVEPGQCEVIYEPLLLLRTLFAQCPDELKTEFVPLLLKHMTRSNAMVIAHAVMDARELRRLGSHIGHFTPYYISICKALDQKLAMESYIFNDSDLNWIDEAQVTLRQSRLKDTESLREGSPVWWLARLKNRIARVRYLRLKKELLEGQNPEINTDKQTLVSRLAALRFRPRIATALSEADKKLSGATTSLDFKGVMDLVRTVYEGDFRGCRKLDCGGTKQSVTRRQESLRPVSSISCRRRRFNR
jgi:hypothetical protein